MRKWVASILGIGIGISALIAVLDKNKPEKPRDQAKYIQTIAQFQNHSQHIWQYLNEGNIGRAAFEAQVISSLVEAQLGSSDSVTKDAEALTRALRTGSTIDSSLNFIVNHMNEYGDFQPSAVRTMETDLFPAFDEYLRIVSDFDEESRGRIETHFRDRLKHIKNCLLKVSQHGPRPYATLLERFNERASQTVLSL